MDNAKKICISDSTGVLQSNIEKCAMLILEKKPHFLSAEQKWASQQNKGYSPIVRVAVERFLKELEKY